MVRHPVHFVSSCALATTASPVPAATAWAAGAPQDATMLASGATRGRSYRGQAVPVELSKRETKLWLYAYVFPRRPSLTFLTLRPRGDASTSIEEYLAEVRFE
jgi:hypothetical protein